ncbi:MAG: hypothetical protein AB1384_05155 [Actinomycetota bacterium]
MKKAPALVLVLLLALAAAAGCGSSAREYAREARSSYISARAVLVGVEKFPSQMEELLRSTGISAVEEDADALIDEARDLLPTASSAFLSAKQAAELLGAEDSEKFNPYADRLLQLCGLNEQLISAYSEFIAASSSVLQGLPYAEDPTALMPTLDYLDELSRGIQELGASIEVLEEETEALYRQITR